MLNLSSIFSARASLKYLVSSVLTKNLASTCKSFDSSGTLEYGSFNMFYIYSTCDCHWFDRPDKTFTTPKFCSMINCTFRCIFLRNKRHYTTFGCYHQSNSIGASNELSVEVETSFAAVRFEKAAVATATWSLPASRWTAFTSSMVCVKKVLEQCSRYLTTCQKVEHIFFQAYLDLFTHNAHKLLEIRRLVPRQFKTERGLLEAVWAGRVDPRPYMH